MGKISGQDATALMTHFLRKRPDHKEKYSRILTTRIFWYLPQESIYCKSKSRSKLLFGHREPKNDTRIMTKYSRQHEQMRHIFNKYPLCLTIPPLLLENLYHWKDQLVHSEFKKERGDKCKTVGTFPCGSCSYCQFMDAWTNITLPNCSTLKPKHNVNFKTPGIVYLPQCECRCYFVENTKLELWRRIYRPITIISKKGPGNTNG